MLERLLCSNVVHELWRYYRLVKKMRDSSFIEKYRWGTIPFVGKLVGNS